MTRTRRMLACALAAAPTAGTAIVVAALFGCSTSLDDEVKTEYSYASICVDGNTGLRVPDNKCMQDYATGSWYYYPAGVVAPAVGKSATGGSYKPPRKNNRPVAVRVGGQPEDGGLINKTPIQPNAAK